MIASLSSELSQPEGQPKRLERMRVVSRILARSCTGVSVVLAVALAAYWMVISDEAILLDARLTGIATHPIGWPVRLAGLAISAVPLACLIWGFLQARRCFESFAENRFFTPENSGQLRGLVTAMLVSTLLKPVAGAALSVVLSWQTCAQGKALVISLSSDSLLALLFVGLVSVTAWVLAEANSIAEENAQFV